jgi:hypothetical protein
LAASVFLLQAAPVRAMAAMAATVMIRIRALLEWPDLSRPARR